MIKYITEKGNSTQYIIGITLRKHQGKAGTFIRMMRTSFALEDIKNMEERLLSKAAAELKEKSDRGNQEDFTHISKRRRKIQE